MNEQATNSMSLRINELIETLDITKKAFALSINRSAGNITDWVKGRCNPSSAALSAIESCYDVRHEWLLNGELPMFNAQLSDLRNNVFKTEHAYLSLTPQEQRVLSLFNQLPYEEQLRIEGMLEIKVLDSIRDKKSITKKIETKKQTSSNCTPEHNQYAFENTLLNNA